MQPGCNRLLSGTERDKGIARLKVYFSVRDASYDLNVFFTYWGFRGML